VKQEPTIDERAGMNWWNSLTEAERTQALKAAGWRSGGTWTPSAADAWAHHKARASTAVCKVCDTRVPADLLLRHEATHSELEHEIARLRRESFIKCPDCGGVGGLETNGPEWVGPMRMESCETCEGTGRLRDTNDDVIEP
jgi:hypothetical protein